MLSSGKRPTKKKNRSETAIRIAIDTGGTFTDCVYSSGSAVTLLKVPSTPLNPAQAVLAAVTQIAGKRRVEVRHGTTVGTNTLLERKGARTCFITTAGFEDVIEIGRQARPKLYDWFFERDPPLAPEDMRIGVDERVSSDGSILRAVTETEMGHVRDWVSGCGAESVAISFLFSFANPRNEQAVYSALRDLNLPVSVSHVILPEFREYERGSTVLINAYLAPKMISYIGEIDRALKRQQSRFMVMQSSGGTMPAKMAAREPVRAILSGPAGGIIGAVTVAREAGYSKVMTFDMGGTSTDVALIDGSRGLEITNEYQIGGMPVAIPMLDIHTVGAGGGSLAWFDRAGALHVGPQSAGAHPGPICYGSGTEPTVTDANLLLGRIDASMFLGGRMKLDEARARAEFRKAKNNLTTVEEFAEGILEIANLRMGQALRKISVERGLDPREFALVSFGGAGPLHACELAESLRISRVLIPAFPGVLSAYGILISDVIRDYSRTVMAAPGDPSIQRTFRDLEMKGQREMKGCALNGVSLRSLDLRYEGQGYELNLPAGANLLLRFHRLHRQRYGYSDAARAVQVVNLRVRLVSASQPVHFPRQRSRSGTGEQAVLRTGGVVMRGRLHKTKIYDRSLLRAGDRFEGPAIIGEYSATTFIPNRTLASIDERGNIVIDINREKSKV